MLPIILSGSTCPHFKIGGILIVNSRHYSRCIGSCGNCMIVTTFEGLHKILFSHGRIRLFKWHVWNPRKYCLCIVLLLPIDWLQFNLLLGILVEAVRIQNSILPHLFVSPNMHKIEIDINNRGLWPLILQDLCSLIALEIFFFFTRSHPPRARGFGSR